MYLRVKMDVLWPIGPVMPPDVKTHSLVSSRRRGGGGVCKTGQRNHGFWLRRRHL